MATLCVALCALLALNPVPPTPHCSPGWNHSWQEIEHYAPPEDAITASYLYLGFPMCRPVTGHVGTSAVFVNLSHYDRTYAAGGNLIQLGIWRSGADNALFTYTEDNGQGALHFLPAPYPQISHRYVLQITRRRSTWAMVVYDQTAGVVDHQFSVTAHWSDARSAWTMLETNDPHQPFAPDTFSANGTQCARRVVSGVGDDLYAVSATPC